VCVECVGVWVLVLYFLLNNNEPLLSCVFAKKCHYYAVLAMVMEVGLLSQ